MKPQIYSETNGRLKAARTITVTNFITFVPIMVLFAWLMIKEIIWGLNYTENLEFLYYCVVMMFTLFFSIFATFTYQTLAYYFRIKSRFEKLDFTE